VLTTDEQANGLRPGLAALVLPAEPRRQKRPRCARKGRPASHTAHRHDGSVCGLSMAVLVHGCYRNEAEAGVPRAGLAVA
jgi:hypothetical protein